MPKGDKYDIFLMCYYGDLIPSKRGVTENPKE